MDDFTKVLQSLPPGTDVFAFLSTMIDDLVYPDLGKAFWTQAYVAIGLCGLVILAIAAGLFICWRKGRLNFLLMDGMATRPNPRVVVPVLWLITGALLITHTLWLRSQMLSYHLRSGLGIFWWLVAAPLVCSYAVISTSVMCTAPAIRKALTHLNKGHSESIVSPSFLLVNGGLLAICVAATCSAYAAGRFTGESFSLIHSAHSGAQALIAKAQAEQNLALMATFGTYTEMLERASDYNTKGTAVGGAIYSALIVLFFLTGLIPALFLNLYLRKRIVRLESGLGTATLYQTSSILQQPRTAILMSLQSEGAVDRDVEILGDGPRTRYKTLLEQPKDRPFANLTSTSMLPMNYASIFRGDADPKEKARKLREALRRDNLQLVAYFLMLASMGSLAFFQAAKGPVNWGTKKIFQSSSAWYLWSYGGPALVLAAAFLYDSITNSSSEDEVNKMQVSGFANRGFHAPPLTSIQLSQVIEVVEEHQLQEKSSIYKDRS